MKCERCGRIAQLGEHLPYKQRVIGSSPITPTIFFGLVVQLVRMPACHAGGRRFEPVPGRQFLKHIICWCGSTVEQLICNQQVGGSIPSTSSIYLATDDTLSQITRLSLKTSRDSRVAKGGGL